MSNNLTVNHVACGVTTSLAVLTIGSTFAAVTATTVTAKVAYVALSVLLGSISIGSLTAWAHESSSNLSTYFENLKNHSGVAVASMSQLVAQTFVQAVVQGIAGGISKSMTRTIAGDDVTIRVKNSR